MTGLAPFDALAHADSVSMNVSASNDQFPDSHKCLVPLSHGVQPPWDFFYPNIFSVTNDHETSFIGCGSLSSFRWSRSRRDRIHRSAANDF
ncbi:hypothetical protein OUZ56_016576 [Daphnia magna]|uniref:Uncharacterized protein n=1 Tax=Daphnia magna TaxID=35525 RepID=A0ABR0AQY8_9CRUS|nr:hypothetical protein OUZ56_016576 [Daphnia magna]